MFLQNQHSIRWGFPRSLLFQRPVGAGVGVFDECLFRYQTSLGEPGNAAEEALSRGGRHLTRREVQNMESGSSNTNFSPDLFPELLGDPAQVQWFFSSFYFPFTFRPSLL